MRTKAFRIIALILALALAACLPACAKETATLNGVDIGSFTIVYSADGPDYDLRAAEYIREQILERTGKELPLQEAQAGTYDHEILVGETGRPLSQTLDAETENVEFAILSDGNHVALEGDYFIIAAAAYYFVQTYIPGAGFETAVPTEITVLSPITEATRSVILLIGDGMGFNQTLMFEHMEPSADVKFYDGEDQFYGYYLPYRGKVHTDSLTGVTDSAAAATAMACGYKTYNGYVGKDKDLKDVQNLVELAAAKGMATAVLSTDKTTGATPSGFSAHAESRDDTSALRGSQLEVEQATGLVLQCGLHSVATYQNMITKILGQMEQSEDGFFLMYEEGYIDKYCDDMDGAGAFDIMVRFNQAIGLYMEYAFYHPDTLVIVTADHETGGLSFDEKGNCQFVSGEHTGADVPIFAYGHDAQRFDGFDNENTEIPKVIASLWGEESFGQP